MWRGEAGCTDDYDGQSVRIYQPILYGGSRKARFDDPTCSCIGGPTSNALRCPQCQDPLYPLVKISTKTTDRNNGNNRTLQVWACNRVACTRKLFEAEPATSDDIETSTDNAHRGLCYGGGKGVVVCRRILTPTAPQPLANESLLPPVVKAAPTSSHNEWAMSMDGTTTSTGDLDDLESKLAAMETNATGSSSKAKPSLNAKPSIPLDRSGAALVESSTGFPIYELHSLPEPLPVRSTEYPMDDDDVGFASSGRGIDDKKIQQMLSQYMAMEDDQDILAALRGTNASGHPAAAAASAGGYGERDERLSAHDRALWTFQDRLKRAPRQVVRYALGGVPMWSIPVKPLHDDSEHDNKKSSKKRSQNRRQSNQLPSEKTIGQEQAIPPCSCCGTPRVFEIQLLPSLLHALEVDKFTEFSLSENEGKTTSSPSLSLPTAYDNGAMDWGSIAIYTCPNPQCDTVAATEEFCVVQDTLDKHPSNPSRAVQGGDVVIQEDAKFNDDDDDDDDEAEGIIVDDDDDGSIW